MSCFLQGDALAGQSGHEAGSPIEIDQPRAVELMAGDRKRAVVESVIADRDLTTEGAQPALELVGLTGPGFEDNSTSEPRDSASIRRTP